MVPVTGEPRVPPQSGVPLSAHAAGHHISDGDLELYALHRLIDAAHVEEHLLVCEECRARLAAWDEYVRAMRTAWSAANRLWPWVKEPGIA